MIFLVVYDRREQRTLTFERFDDTQRAEARRRRLDAQLEVPKEEGRYEVVLLESRSEEDLRITHSRYFLSTAELIASSKEAVTAFQIRQSGREKRAKLT